MIPGEIHKHCQIPKNCQCKWLLVSSRVPGTFASFSGFLLKFCFCTDTLGSIEWLSPEPRLHIGDCFEIRKWSLKTLWSAVIKAPFFSTRYGSTIASSPRGPCNFSPLADLAISVFRRMSINTVFKQILTLLEYGLWRWFVSRIGVRVSVFWNFVIHQIFPEFLQPLRNFRIYRVSPFPQQRVSPFFSCFFLFFWIFICLVNIGWPWSLMNRIWHLHGRDVTLSSILPFSSLDFTYSWFWRRAGRRCWAMTPLSWKCPRSWWVRSRRRIWQAIPFQMRCGFLTIDPFVGLPVFIAKLSERQYCWHVFEEFHS